MPLDPVQKLQEDEYAFPYHHLVGFPGARVSRSLWWGLEYFAYLSVALDMLDRAPWRALLEVGCGDGKCIAEIARRFPGRRLVGVDYSERAILFAKAFNYGNGAELECADVASLTEDFDVVAVIDVLEHIPEPGLPAFVRALGSRLGEGGTLLVSVPTDRIPVARAKKHYRHYNLEMLAAQLPGFRLEERRYVMKAPWRRLLFALSVRAAGWPRLERLVGAVASKVAFSASAESGTHLVARFTKE